MPIPEHVLRFWRALDALFSDVTPTWWGAVVTDGRFPRIWDANYARVEVGEGDLRAGDIEDVLVPAARAAGAPILHVVLFRPEAATRLLSDLSSAGHRLSWDTVMELGPTASLPDEVPGRVEALSDGDELWEAVARSFALFGVEPAEAVDELRTIEREVLAPGGKRWFGVRDGDGTLVSLGAIHLLESVGYIDNVATAPAARGRGHASAIVTRIVREARAAGAAHVFLLADPDDAPVVRLYRRLGFTGSGQIASIKGPLPQE